MTKILVVGVSVLDFIFQMEVFPSAAEKYRAESAEISGGGNAANAAVAIARLGGEAHLASRIGDDEIADLILEGLRKEKVNTQFVRRFLKHRSSFSSICIDASGERQIINYRDTDLTMDSGWFSDLLDQENETYSAILADTRWPDGALTAMKFAKSKGIPGILDAEAPILEANEALFASSHVAFSAKAARDFTGETDIAPAALAADTKLPGKVIVTDGPRDVVSIENGEISHHPAFLVDAVDTLAAGDIWHGAFALALGKGWIEKHAIRLANAAAAIKCTKPGGREGAPTDTELTRFLKEKS